MGSQKLHAFVTQQIKRSDGDVYMVGVLRRRIIAMCSWRNAGDRLILNHLYVLPRFRGQGFGTNLMLELLRRFRRPQQRQVAVDVFLENERARSWYRSWGMQVESRTSWLQVPMPNLASVDGVGWSITGLAEADDAQATYGFSQFTLRTDITTYTVGRLGHSLFRVGTFSILDDSAALRALVRLDSRRQLLCLGPSEQCPAERFRREMVVVESERLVSPCDHIQAVLSTHGALRQDRLPSRVV